ncbi:MAG: alpha/beta fold hydrolase [Proteobacteria bacterium]|nr:MAG: alpha/beta fold hydrolase [Pseudomonadota bacterium]
MKRFILGLLLLLSLSLPAEAKREVVARTLMQRAPLRNPIVLVHGATTKGSRLQIGWMDFGEYFHYIAPYYRATGSEVKTAELSTDGTIEERAAVLKNFIETEYPGRMVNIVAHSLGGLDARYMVSVLGSQQVSSITTIGTPHLGTPLANWADRQVRKGYPWYWFFRLIGYDMAKRRFLKEITTDFMRDVFNPKVQDSPDVRYFSVQTKATFDGFTMSHLLWFPTRWLENERSTMSDAGHDGMVPFDSMKWGRVIGVFEADHLAQINHQEFRSTDQTDISYNIYMNIYDNLAKERL